MHPSWYVEFRMAIFPQRIHFRFRSGSADFRFDQIQDGSRPLSWKIIAASRGFPATAGFSCSILWLRVLNFSFPVHVNFLYCIACFNKLVTSLLVGLCLQLQAYQFLAARMQQLQVFYKLGTRWRLLTLVLSAKTQVCIKSSCFLGIDMHYH